MIGKRGISVRLTNDSGKRDRRSWSPFKKWELVGHEGLVFFCSEGFDLVNDIIGNGKFFPMVTVYFASRMQRHKIERSLSVGFVESNGRNGTTLHVITSSDHTSYQHHLLSLGQC